MSSNKEVPGFALLPLTDLPTDIEIPISIFVYMPQNNKMLMYRPTGTVLDQARLLIMKKTPDRFFLRKEDYKVYEEFLVQLKSGPKKNVVPLSASSTSAISPDEAKTILQNRSAELLMTYFSFQPDPESKLTLVEQANKQITTAVDEVFDLLAIDEGILAKVKDMQKTTNNTEWNHPLNVSTIATLFALCAGYTNKNLLKEIATAGYLHDIGLMNCNIPMPRRNQKYNNDQLSRYRYHPIAGLEMIETLELNVSESVKLMVYQHEEKFEGGGFPMGVSGDDIFEPSQLIAIASRFDHLVRIDEPGWLNPNEALTKIRQENSTPGTPSAFNPVLLNKIIEATYSSRKLKVA